MWLLNFSKDSRTYEMSAREIRICCRAIREALYALSRVSDEHFLVRIGADREHAERLADQIAAHLPGNPDASSLSGIGTSIELSTTDAEVLVRTMCELVYGIRIPEWEFHALTGFDRAEARELLRQVHLTLVSGANELHRPGSPPGISHS